VDDGGMRGRAGPAVGLTAAALVEDLRALGLSTGDTVIVHVSLRAVGRLREGATTMLSALLDTVGAGGTVVAPTQTHGPADPGGGHAAAVFDPATTPSRGCGQLAEAVRTWPGAVRSGHPHLSFAAVGRRAAHLMAHHDLSESLGPGSPLGRLVEVDARVLLIGVGFERATILHLAEYGLPDPVMVDRTCAVADTIAAGGTRWITYSSRRLYSGDLANLGRGFSAPGTVREHSVGAARGRLFSARAAVSFASAWLSANRSPASRRPG
jgi:aminoglycoside 3-N-acetyltransferase